MSVFKKRLPWLIFSLLALVLGMVLVSSNKVAADHTVNSPCSVTNVNHSSTQSTGTGRVYRTVEVAITYESTVQGHTLQSDCTLTGASGGALEWYGMQADEVWMGPKIPGVWDATSASALPSPRPSFGCTVVAPNQPGVERCGDKFGNGSYAVFQDDASAISFGDDGFIHCNGIDPICDNDIYRNGWEYSRKGKPIRGAGYFYTAPKLLTGKGKTSGKLNNIPISMFIRNTWSGGYGSTLVLSLGYPQIPPSTPVATVSCRVPPLNDLELGSSLSGANVGYTVNSGTVDSNYAMTISYDGGSFGGVGFSPNPASGAGTTFGYDASYPSPTLGRHTINWKLTGPSGFATVSCDTSYKIYSIPYLKVYGNDVRVGLRDGQGSEEASDCPGWDDRRTAGIKAMWHDTGKKGAGAQLGIESLGEILSFASSAVRTPLVPYYLAFANTDPPRNGSFGAFDIGGDYGDIYCSKNFFSYHPSQAPRTDTSLAMNDVNINGHTTYIRPSTGTLTLTNGTTLSGGTVMYVEGNVVLSGDFKYSGSNSWATIDSIPYFYLVVKGNIYVDKGTTYMDGVYIAQPTTITSPGQGYTDGKIYTCTSGSSLFGGTNIHANCNSQLKVYGALIAQQIRFLRTLNTIGQSSSGQLAGAGGSAAPSEEIQFSPEIYLVPSPFDDGSGQSASTDQDITSLPPIF